MRGGLVFLVLISTPPANAIYNGQPVPAHSLLAQVSVKLTTRPHPNGPTDCSGTRIAHNYILTAAHCVSVAHHAVFAGGRSFRVAEAWTHPHWDNETDAYDFAVLRVDGNLPHGPAADIAAPAEQPLKTGEVLTTTGFGYTETGLDGELRKTELTVKTPHYSRTEILASGRRTGICGGDSGGGFVRIGNTVKIFGVASSTVSEDRYGCDDHVFFANVQRAHEWIRALKGPPTFLRLNAISRYRVESQKSRRSLQRPKLSPP